MTLHPSTWLPRFVCPECQGSLAAPEAQRRGCERCDRSYECRDGVWRFLSVAREQALEPLVHQYRIVRAREGRHQPPGVYQQLPVVSGTDPHAGDWRIRQETYRHLLGQVFAPSGPRTVLDLGAGCGWLSYRLSRLGHHVAAVDAIDDEQEGVGVTRHFDCPVVAIRADFDALPLAAGQFDVVVFNGSLHYARDVMATLAHGHARLAPGGTLVVMDSPMFKASRDGAAMVADMVRRFARDYELREIVQAGSGYLTFASLASAARSLCLTPAFVPSRGPLAWRVKRQLSRLRLGRQPAAFGLWVAR